MTAKEAKELSRNSRTVEMSVIFNSIKSAALKGDDSVGFNLEGNYAKFASEIMDKLRAQGYKVQRERESDCRDNSSWDYLSISW